MYSCLIFVVGFVLLVWPNWHLLPSSLSRNSWDKQVECEHHKHICTWNTLNEARRECRMKWQPWYSFYLCFYSIVQCFYGVSQAIGVYNTCYSNLTWKKGHFLGLYNCFINILYCRVGWMSWCLNFACRHRYQRLRLIRGSPSIPSFSMKLDRSVDCWKW